MALARWQSTIVDDEGNVQSAASVEVRAETSGAPLATIYSDRDGTTPLGNPMTAESDGFAAFHVAGGAYKITATKGGFSRVWRYVPIGLGAEADGQGDVIGPETSSTGQLVVFSGTDGSAVAGAEADGSPTAPLLASDLLLTTDIGSTVQAFDADTLKADTADTLTAGFNATEFDAGTKSTGTFTPDPANGNFQKAVNGGAHTLAPPGSTCSIVIQYTNNGSAGAITTSGFTTVTGDDFTTTNGHDFLCYIVRNNGFSHLNVVALQ